MVPVMLRLLLAIALLFEAGACDYQPPAPAQQATASKLAEAGGLKYLELITGGADKDALLPMIVAIHGRGDSPQGFRHLLANLPVPSRVILPRGLYPEGSGFSWFSLSALSPDKERFSAEISKAAQHIVAGLRELAKDRPTRGKMVLTGFSQGGILSFTLADSHPDLFTVAIPVAGTLPPPLHPGRIADPADYPPIVALHGDRDPALLIEPTRASIEALRKLGLRAELHEYPGIRHTIPPAMRAELMHLLGAAARSQATLGN
jgi:phospholipase/carboxylesterase